MLREAEDAFHVEFVEPRLVQFDLDQSSFFAELVPLAIVGRLVDALLVDERLLFCLTWLSQSIRASMRGVTSWGGGGWRLDRN